MADVILALQIVAGLPKQPVLTGDVNGDNKIGLEEAIFALQTVAQLRYVSTGKARAMLGPLAGSTVNVYRLNDLKSSVYITTTDTGGYFDTVSLSVNNTDYVLVAVSGGVDTDANDDGVSGDTVQNTGTIYALMTAEKFAAGNFIVSAITDIAYQYSKNLIGQADNAWIKTRLDDLSKNFFVADINGDGVTDSLDLLAFSPINATHKGKLNFDFQNLFTPDQNGNSIIKAYHENSNDVLSALLEAKFASRLTLYTMPDTRYQKVKIKVAAFGKGSVKSDIGGIDIDSSRQNATDNVKYAFFDQSATAMVVLMATPAADTQILSWNGCDTVSPDKTRCESNLRADRLITVSFGYKETKLKDGVVLTDLSNALVTLSADQVTLNVTANTGDTDMASKLAASKAGDVVVGSAGGGFLRRIVSVQKISDLNYILTTADVSLEEVIAQGTGEFFKQMTYGDLADSSTAQRSIRSTAMTAGFEGIEGVRLIPSDDPNDRVFKIQIGDSPKRDSMGGELTWWDPKSGFNVTLKGTIDVTIDIDKGASYSLIPPGLEYLKLIYNVTATESLDLSVGGKLKISGDIFKKDIGKLKFAPVSFPIGPVLVWITPEVIISIGGDIEVGGQLTGGIKLQQTARLGAVYNRSVGIEWVYDFEPSFDPTTDPTMPMAAQDYFEVKPYIQFKPWLMIYSLTGPALGIKGYEKIRGEMNVPFFNDPCSGGIFLSIFGGAEAEFEWDLDSFKKFGNWAKDIELKVTLSQKEELLKK